MLKSQYPIRMLCELMELSRSSYYYQAAPGAEGELRQVIEEVAAQFPTYGSRRLAHQVRREPFNLHVNRKRMRRLMGEMGLKCRVKERKVKTTDSRHHFPRYENLVSQLQVTR